jgi:glyoxylase I family protein
VEGIDHLDLVVTDLDRSLAFYRGLLVPLGYESESHITGERGEPVTYLGRASGGGSIGLRERQSEVHAAPYDRYTVGVHHIAFAAPCRATVDDRARWIAQQGMMIESGPEEYDYAPGYYAVFFYDPDSIKLEVVHFPGQ